MLIKEPTAFLIKEWLNIYNKNKYKLKLNKKFGLKIIKYLKNRYFVMEIETLELKEVVHIFK